MRVYSIEGLIGAGKSTILALLRKAHPGCKMVFVPEPVSMWENVNGAGNLLEKFYKDQKRYAYAFETYVLLTRVTALQEAMRNAEQPDTVFLLERSWESSRHVFGELTNADGHLTGVEWEMYKQMYEYLTESAPRIDGHIFVDVSADVALARIQKRGRPEEAGITLEFEQALARSYTAWLDKTATPVLKIDGNQEFEVDLARFEKLQEEIRDFITPQPTVDTPGPRLPLRRAQEAGLPTQQVSFETPSPFPEAQKRRCMDDLRVPKLDVTSTC